MTTGTMTISMTTTGMTMTTGMPLTTALIAEDEPLLADALVTELRQQWPDLRLLGIATDGHDVVTKALALQPDVLFLDIRMPGQDGLEAAEELADAWTLAPTRKPYPVIVFVTAFDQYAVRAFDMQAVDYLLKPVHPDRLRNTLGRVRQALGHRDDAALEAHLAQLRSLIRQSAPPDAPPIERLTIIPAAVGTTVHMVPIDEVVVFEAADKYVRVLTTNREYLLRTPLKELVPRLDDAVFWQVHRGTVVRASAIDRVTRDEGGRLWVHVKGRPDTLAVSRVYAARFRSM